MRSLRGRIPLIVDGGPSNVGLESTVVDLSTAPCRVLRPGIIHAEALALVLGVPVLEGTLDSRGTVLRSPGLLERHYAPRARLLVFNWQNDAELAAHLEIQTVDPHTTHLLAHSNIPIGSNYARVSVIPHDPEAFARALYAELHKADELGAITIVVESTPDEDPWRAIADRLRRASA